MRVKKGDKVEHIKLPAIDGSEFSTESLIGRPFMISFFRFAGCPFCNMRVHELVKRFSELGDDFNIVAIFDSPLDNLILHANKHKAPFPILADEENKFYKKYGIERSIKGFFKGLFTKTPIALEGMFKGYFPKRIKGKLTTMPAEFLVDRNGIIQTAYYGKDEGDHLQFEHIKEFALQKE